MTTNPTEYIRTKRKWGKHGKGRGRPYFSNREAAIESARVLANKGKAGAVDVWVRVATIYDLREETKNV